ncbi:MAG TPA: sensor domain-containing diguanylate cyclase [Miltoncostaeaceae bacterium]|nr:sensor domain-containing diguanylate cyclase [Miltoncostaeaceae bacterium]
MDPPSTHRIQTTGAADRPELATALSQIAHSAQLALSADRATCYSHRPLEATVDAIHTTERDPARRAPLEYAIGRGLTELPFHALLRGEDPVLVIEDARDDPRLHPRLADHLGFRSLIGARLEHESVQQDGRRAFLGTLICSYTGPRTFTSRDHATIRSLALVASLALAATHLQTITARDLQRMRDLEAEQAALRRVATRIATAGSLEVNVFGTTAEECARLLGADIATITRAEDGLGIVLGATGDSVAAGEPMPELTDGLFGRTVRRACSLTIECSEDLPPDSPQRRRMERLGIRAAVSSPVIVDGAVWGVIIAGFRDHRRLPADAGERMSHFATLVAISIANSERRRLLVEQSTRDPLTGLANHRAFFDRLANELERSRRRNRPLSLVMVDIDHFKRVNDRFGHLAGDAVLQEFADRLREEARTEDTLGRIGGEEFAWLMPETAIVEALGAAERVRITIEAVPFSEAGRITLSAGVAQLEDDMDARALRAAADAALYRAKDAGRNRAIVAGPT